MYRRSSIRATVLPGSWGYTFLTVAHVKAPGKQVQICRPAWVAGVSGDDDVVTERVRVW